MAFDPNLPNDVKQGLKNRTVPFQFGGAMMTDSAFARNPVGTAAMVNGKPMTASQVTPAPGSQVMPATSVPVAPQAPKPTPVFNRVPTGDTVRPAGLHALPQGVVRSSIPGVYLARGKDGSFMASNVMGTDGMPDFGGTSQASQRMGLRAHNANPGGTQVDPRTQIADMGGWVQGPGAQGGTYDPSAGVVDANGAASLPGAVAGQRGGFTYAENSLHMNPADMIKAAGINPEAAQQAKEQLIASMNNDPNSSNPEVAASNRAALAQLEGNVHDVRQQYYGGSGSPYGMVGGIGTGGARGGLGLRDILTNRYRNANLAERTARDQATDQYRQQTADRADRTEARQGAQYFMTNYQNAESKLPGSGDALIAQTTPQGLSSAEFKKWVTTNPAGQAWSQALLQSMQRGAAESLKTPFGIPVEWGDRANIAGNVNFGNMKLDKNGNFAGFFDNSDNPTNEYPRNSGFWGSPNYDESLLRTISPSYWKVLQQIGLRRSQPASSE